MTEASENRLLDDAAKLATEVAPERDLWPDIENRLERPGHRRSMPWYAQAAAVLLLVGGSSYITWILATASDAELSPVVTSAAFDAEFTSFGREFTLGPDFEHARNGLATELDVVLDELPPEVRVEVERNLAIIRGAVDDIKEALEREPNSEHLHEMLADAYRRELALMRQIGGQARSVSARNDI